MPIIALVDCNNFFVSCEQLFSPHLKGKPVCVLSNNDGCVIARSNEAKDLGITMGMPYFMAKKQFKNVAYISGNHSRYGEISKRIMEKLYEITPNVEIYSIDEAFLDVSGTEKMHHLDPIEIGEKIKKLIADEIGIDVSVGLSGSKTLSKLASEIAKKEKRKDKNATGVHYITNEILENILQKTPIEDIWGIGYNFHKLMRRHNIRSAWDFVCMDNDFIKRHMHKVGLDMKDELLNICKSPIEEDLSPPKSISKSASFKEFTSDKDYIKNALTYHSHRVCSKLRKLNLTGKMLHIMLRTKEFRVLTSKIALDFAVDSEFEINEKIYKMLDEIYAKGIVYRSAGVGISKVCPKVNSQLSLFQDEKNKKSKQLSAAWDKIENKYGQGSLNMGMIKNMAKNNKSKD